MLYSVIETRDFSLFNQSAQALLKCYFIKYYSTRGKCIGVLIFLRVGQAEINST